MSLYWYDEALARKFKNWTEHTEITFTSPDETRRLFQVIDDKNNDRGIKFPLVCLRRLPGYSILPTGKRPQTFSGYSAIRDNNSTASINTIPVTLRYQLDVYTRYMTEADEYMRNFIFNIINYPKFEVNVIYNGIEFNHVGNILPGNEVVDNSSSTSELLSAGQFTRLSFQFSVEDACLWDIRIRENKRIVSCGLEIIDKTTDEVIVEPLDIG